MLGWLVRTAVWAAKMTRHMTAAGLARMVHARRYAPWVKNLRLKLARLIAGNQDRGED